jgi:tRNA pseudouridine38-40 synthase
LVLSDIRCISIEPCDGLFRPAASAISKEYRYFFTNKTQVDKKQQRFIANISNVLDLGLMLDCAQLLVGMHDFCNFYSSGSNVKSTIRKISICELTEINPNDILLDSALFPIDKDLNKCFELRIEANGFLKQMIRHLVSALWMVGSGKLSSAEFMTLLNGPKILKQRWKVAPPNGLFLYQINYPI